MDSASYQGLELDAKVELIRGLIPLALMHMQELLDEKVRALTGARYARGEGYVGVRHGGNPGSDWMLSRGIGVVE